MEELEMTKECRDGSGTAEKAGIIHLGETIGLCLTTVR